MNRSPAGNKPITQARLSFEFSLMMVRNLRLDYDRPAIGFLDKNVRTSALFKNPANMLGSEGPFVSQSRENLA